MVLAISRLLVMIIEHNGLAVNPTGRFEIDKTGNIAGRLNGVLHIAVMAGGRVIGSRIHGLGHIGSDLRLCRLPQLEIKDIGIDLRFIDIISPAPGDIDKSPAVIRGQADIHLAGHVCSIPLPGG